MARQPTSAQNLTPTGATTELVQVPRNEWNQLQQQMKQLNRYVTGGARGSGRTTGTAAKSATGGTTRRTSAGGTSGKMSHAQAGAKGGRARAAKSQTNTTA